MVYDYVVTLKNERKKYLDFVSIIICLISFLFFINAFINSGFTQFVFPIAAILIAVIAGYNIYSSFKAPGITKYYSRALMIAGIIWFALPVGYFALLGAIFILLSLVEKYSKANLEIGFDNNNVVINTLIKRSYQWSDFSNIVLKDNILTLDFQNNKIIQQETIDEPGDADEEEFNDWCRERLRKSAPQFSGKPNF